MIVEFIDAKRDEFGVEPICRVLQVAPSTYYAAKARPLSARAIRDAVLKVTSGGVVADQLRGLRDPEALEGRRPRRRGRRPGTSRPVDARTRHRRGPTPETRPHHQSRRPGRPAPRPRRPAVRRVETQRIVGHRPDLRADLGRRRLRVLHRRRVQPHDCRVARRGEHVHRHGPRRVGDGPLGQRHQPPRPRLPLRRRIVSSPSVPTANASPSSARSPRSARTATTTPRRDRQRALQDRVSVGEDPGATSTRSSSPPSSGSTGSTPSASTAPSATSHPRSSKQRSTLPNRPTPSGWNPIARASIRPRAIHSSAHRPTLAIGGGCYDSSTSAETTSGRFRGTVATPTAVRASAPTSRPKTFRRRSENGLSTSVVVRVARICVHEPVHHGPSGDPVELTDRLLEASKHRQRGQSSRLLRGLQRHLARNLPEWTRRRAVRSEGTVSGHESAVTSNAHPIERDCDPRRQLRTRWKLEPELVWTLLDLSLHTGIMPGGAPTGPAGTFATMFGWLRGQLATST